MAARLAVLEGQSGPSAPGAIAALGEILLALNDLSSSDASPQNEDEAIGLLSRALSLMPTEAIAHRVGRYQRLFVEPPEAESIRVAFQDERGFSIDEFRSAILVARYRLVEVAKSGNVEGIWEVADWLSSLLAAAPLDRVARALAANRDDLRSAFPTLDDAHLTLSNFGPFYDKPLYRAVNGSLLPVSLAILNQLLGPGLYWFARESLQGKPKHAHLDFGASIGHLFEDYLTDLLKRMYPPSGGGRYLAESEMGKYWRAGQRVDPCDGVLIEEGRAIAFEFWSSPISLAAYAGDGARLRKDLATEIRSKFMQLHDFLVDLLTGSVRFTGVDLSAIQVIQPVLVVLHPLPQYPHIWEVLRGLLEAAGFFDYPTEQPSVVAPQILSADDMEHLEPIVRSGAAKLSHLITQKLGHPYWADVSMRWWLQEEAGLLLDDTDEFRNQVRAATDAAGEVVSAAQAAQRRGPDGR